MSFRIAPSQDEKKPEARVTPLWNGTLQVNDENGSVYHVGSEHPDYHELRSRSRTDPKRIRLHAILAILAGLSAWLLNAYLLITTGYYSFALVFLGPLGTFSGLLALLRPELGQGLFFRQLAPKYAIGIFAREHNRYRVLPVALQDLWRAGGRQQTDQRLRVTSVLTLHCNQQPVLI